MTPPRLTLDALARSLGLSKTTVSRALSGQGRLPQATRERVRAAAEAAGFAPSRLAASLSTGRTGLVALVLGGVRTPVALSVMAGVVEEATAAGYQVVVHVSATEADDAAVYRGPLAGQSVDGVIHQFPSRAAGEALARFAARGTPAVAVDPEGAVPGVPVLRVDSFADGAALTGHLIAQGHRRIGLAAERPGWGGLDRFAQGWRAALEGAGLPADPALCTRFGWTADDGARAAAALRAAAPPATAMVFCCDVAALGAIAWLAGRGLRVPQDVAVAGYDDTEMAGWTTPPLTTLAGRRDGLARLAWARLAAAFAGAPPPAGVEDVAAPLRPRASTAAPPRLRWGVDPEGDIA